MLTVAEYAETRGKSAQAVYKQLRRKSIAAELEGHIVIKRVNNRDVKVLDDKAVRILDAAGAARVIVQEGDDEREKRIASLEAENKALLVKITELQDTIINKQNEIGELQAKQIEAIESEPDTERPGIFRRIWHAFK